jgi:hypothetical protein
VDSLIAIVDARASSWAPLDAVNPAQAPAGGGSADPASSTASPPALPFATFLTTLETFLCAYGAGSRRAHLAVLAFNDARGGYVFPPPPPDGGSAASSSAGDGSGGAPDLLRPAAIRRAVGDALMALHYEPIGQPPAAAAALAASGERGRAEDDGAADAAAAVLPRLSRRHGSLAACLSLAVCHHHKLWRGARGSSKAGLRGRVLVVQAGPDAPSQYVQLVNCAFTAQRFGVTVDSLLLTRAGPPPAAGTLAAATASSPTAVHTATAAAAAAGGGSGSGGSSGSRSRHSVFLEQAGYLTGGQHVHPTPAQWHALLATMVHLLLPPPGVRGQLLLPPPSSVDLRAHCFCHRAHRTVAWVCTVCLAIYCAYSPVCATCGTRAPGA